MAESLEGITGVGGGNNPVSYYLGKDQTRKVGQNYTPGGTGNDRAAEFKTVADITHDGGKTDLLTITNASDEPNIDMENGPDNCVLQFPAAARYHLLFQGYSEVTSQAAFRVELREIQEETDDLMVTHTSGWTSAPSPARTTYQLIWPDLVVDGTEKYYFLFPVSGASNRSHFLRIETVD